MKNILLFFLIRCNESSENKFLIIFFLLIFGTFSGSLLAQSTSENYMLTKIYKTETSIPVSNPRLDQAAMTITYYDALGRPKQQVAHSQAGNDGDLVTHIEYDSLGRQIKDFLPYVRSSASLGLDGNAAINTASFYSPSGDGPTTDNPWSQSVYEVSAMNRVLMQAAPGDNWAVGSGNEIQFDYETNSANDVRHYGVTLSGGNASLRHFNRYPIGQLYKTVAKNENWKPGNGNKNTTEEYKNKLGQIVLRRSFDHFDGPFHGGTMAFDTYYVYDIYGNLTFVLPPKLSEQLPSNGIPSNILMNELAYQYQYDQRNRMVKKKIPGKKWETITYDALDRPISVGPVLSPFADGAEGKLHTKYDKFNRVAYTLWTPGPMAMPFSSKPAQQISETRTPNTSTVGGVSFSYSNKVQPHTGHILTVNYYDDYAYINAPTVPSHVGENGEIGVAYNNAKKPQGLPTGNWTRILTTTAEVDAVSSFSFYDKKARPVRVESQYPNNGKTQVDIRFNFKGDPIYTLTKHKKNGAAQELKVREGFGYTDQSRLAWHNHKINNGPTRMLAQNSYDPLGRLHQKEVGNPNILMGTPLQIVDYKYNIRGWLTDINNVNNLNQSGGGAIDLFAFKINYDQVDDNMNGAVNPLYNGNIAETYWRTATDNIKRKYGYDYDLQNRLRAAYYQLPNTAIPRAGSYDTHYTYDLNGNILTLKRNGEDDDPNNVFAIDDLHYTYNHGNQLKKVSDATTHSAGYNDRHTSANVDDFEYDTFGNLIKDRDKDIQTVVYNHLNLPVKVTFGNGASLAYTYTANGTKIKKTATDSQNATTSTEYVDGFQYTDEVLDFFPHSEGYVKATESGSQLNFNYVFNFTDHLGNIRLKYTEHPQTGELEILEENHYYPYGLTHQGYNGEHRIVGLEQPGTPITLIPVTPGVIDPYKYKFGGMEYQDEFDINTYDFGARNYDPALGRWMNIDPLAELMRRHSPYNYAFNNPVFFIDPDGMAPETVIITGNMAKEATAALNSSTSLDITRDEKTGELSASGLAETKADKQLLNAINSKDIEVTVTATDSNFDKDNAPIVGGIYDGSEIANGITKAFQTVNPNQLAIKENFYGEEAGVGMMHEVLEAYIGAKDSPGIKGPTNEQVEKGTKEGKAYLKAHKKASQLDSRFVNPHTLYDANGVYLTKFPYDPLIPQSLNPEILINNLR